MPFKWIPGYKGKYKINKKGAVRSIARTVVQSNGNSYDIKSKTLKHTIGNHGYPIVGLGAGTNNKFLVHRLVLLTFKGECPRGYEALHGDGNPKNCKLSNLKWGTSKENKEDKVRHGTMLTGEDCSWSILTEKQVIKIKKRLAKGEKETVISKDMDVNYWTVLSISQGHNWSHVEVPGFKPRQRNRSAKRITEDTAKKIIGLINKKVSIDKICEKFEVSRSVVKRIHSGETWSHLKGLITNAYI